MSIRIVRFVGFARVSTKEQQAEGQSLAVQEKAIRAYVAQVGGHLVKIFCIAESARASEARRVFREMMAFVEDPANKIDCVVFKAVDRATRNTTDLGLLEALWEQRKIDVRIVEGDMRVGSGKSGLGRSGKSGAWRRVAR